MSVTYTEKCKICGTNNWSIFYEGPIRIGKFGNWSKSEDRVWLCNKCKSVYLPGQAPDYETEDYRQLVDGESSTEHFYEVHDGEQLANLKVLGTDKLRNKVIADVGAGAGSFLDLIKGFASDTLAIEPAEFFQKELAQKGHKVYDYCESALPEWKGKVDIVVLFAVLEHIEEPLKLLKEARALLKPGGYLLMSTPNYDDWLINFLPGIYDRFFYRYVHRWYFNGASLENISNLAGFSDIEIQYVHRFDMSNALCWIRDNKPTGIGKYPDLMEIDKTFHQTLEKNKSTDFLYATMRVQ